MATEVIGDRWSLVVLRDVMFGPHRRFRELLRGSQEGIASNILASRLAKLTAAGLLDRRAEPGHSQKVSYHLTEASIQLVPVVAHLGAWGSLWLPTTPQYRIRAELLAEGGPPLWDEFMDELRAEHLRGEPVRSDGVGSRLDKAYQRLQA